MKNGLWLSAVVAVLLGVSVAVPVGAVDRYVVKNGSADYRFSVTRPGYYNVETTNVWLDSALSFIRNTAAGNAVEINFDTTGGGVNVGAGTVSINQRTNVTPSWGDISVTGSVVGQGTGDNNSVISINTDDGLFNVKIRGKISVVGAGSRDAVRIGGRVSLRLDTCTITADNGRALYSESSSSGSNIDIVGGRFKGGSPYEVINISGSGRIEGGYFESTKKTVMQVQGDFSVGGGATFVTNSDTAATVATVILYSGNVWLGDVVIKNQNRDGYAVSMTSVNAKLVLGGPISPSIAGKIEARYPGSINIDTTFYPDKNVYNLELGWGACHDGAVAVVGGAGHLGKFVYVGKDYYRFDTKGDDIVVGLKSGIATPSYIITGNLQTGYIASIKSGSRTEEIKRADNLSAILDTIRTNADGRSCNIRFGDDSSGVGTGSIRIDGVRNGVQWGRVMLSGKTYSTRSGGYGGVMATIMASGGVAVESRLDNSSATALNFSVIVGQKTTFIHHSGELCSGIENKGGTVTIDGGVVGSDSLDGCAINNDKNGKVVISGDAVVVSANTNIQDGTITNYGELEINGGTIEALNGYAVFTSGTSKSVRGRAVISGNAEVISPNPAGAVYVGIYGDLYLFGGWVSSTAALNGNSTAKAIVAYEGGTRGSAGRLVMSGSPEVDGIISLPGGNDFPIEILRAPGYVFNPGNKIYRVAMPTWDGSVVVENGAGFSNNFSLDTTGGIRLMLAVNANDVVATGSACEVSFRINGAGANVDPPVGIKVTRNGTIGVFAKPATNGYLLPVNKIGYPNDGEWYECTQPLADGKDVMKPMPFQFSDYGFHNGTPVTESMKLTLNWGENIPNSVLESSRDLPAAGPAESAAVAPVAAASGSLTAGPSPVSSASGGTVNFFRSGVALKGGKLFIYDASGNVVTKVIVNDSRGGTGRRAVARWDLQDAAGRKVAEGTYVARGIVATKAGKSERVSILISVR